MKNFYCESCGSRVFFENTVCLSCNTSLAFDLENLKMVSIGPESSKYKLCQNYEKHSTCNWAINVESEDPLCSSCALTEVIPNLSLPENLRAWAKIEEAKRRLVYNLNRLGLRPKPRNETNPDGLLFRFLADSEDAKDKPVLTGHANGIVTLNIAEANDAEREQRRTLLGEPYRTLLGHLRHEVGHYYWDMLVLGSAESSFRSLFGDETLDYQEALKLHYSKGPPTNWKLNHISAYAAAHAWEDWAETWAHYLHMMDSLGTAIHSKVQIHSSQKCDPTFSYNKIELQDFDSIAKSWPAIACTINSFNRSLGMPDAYPFVTAPPVVEKLKFIHEIILKRHVAGTE